MTPDNIKICALGAGTSSALTIAVIVDYFCLENIADKLKKSYNFKLYAKNAILDNRHTSYWPQEPYLIKQYIEGYNINLEKFI